MKKIILILFAFYGLIGYSEENKIGLSLAGGGAKGLAHIGVLKVLEEENIAVEFVSGTSMGAIIGALYAIGYSGEELEEFATTVDWFANFDDSLLIKEIPFEEKKYEERYIITLVLDKWSVRIPNGLLKGQRIEQMLKRLVWDVREKDFSKFPRSFVAIATDIETGKQVLLDKGDLAKALRSSMAIPTIFAPIEKDGKLLLDGMLVNNFPVEEVKEMGANIVIGVDVSSNLLNKEKVNNIFEIMNQSISFRSFEKTLEQREICDILIMPDLENYGAGDYLKAKEIIKKGEEAAREKIKEIRKLRDENKFIKIKEKSLVKNKEIYIENLDLSDINEKFRNLVEATINWKLPKMLTKEDADKAIEKIYHTSFFNKVSYEIIGSTLKIEVEELKGDLFRLGIRYDSEQKASLLLNTTLKNITLAASKTFIDLKLSENPMIVIDHYTYKGINNKFGINLKTAYLEQPFFLYNNKKKESEFQIREFELNLALSNVMMEKIGFKYGIDYQFMDASFEVGSSGENSRESFYTYVLRFSVEDLDKNIFPKSGKRLKSKLEFGDIHLGNNLFFRSFDIDYDRYFKLNKKFSFILGTNFINVEGDEIPLSLFSFIGGEFEREGVISFSGLKPLEGYVRNMLMGNIGFQHEIKKDRYILLEHNIARNFTKKENTNIETYLRSYSISLGANTLMGPIKFKLSKAENRDTVFYFNIGYNF